MSATDQTAAGGMTPMAAARCTAVPTSPRSSTAYRATTGASGKRGALRAATPLAPRRSATRRSSAFSTSQLSIGGSIHIRATTSLQLTTGTAMCSRRRMAIGTRRCQRCAAALRSLAEQTTAHHGTARHVRIPSCGSPSLLVVVVSAGRVYGGPRTDLLLVAAGEQHD